MKQSLQFVQKKKFKPKGQDFTAIWVADIKEYNEILSLEAKIEELRKLLPVFEQCERMGDLPELSHRIIKCHINILESQLSELAKKYGLKEEKDEKKI